MKHDEWVDKYLKTRYFAIIAGRYDKGCYLYFKDINNFIQNVGRFANVEIVRMDDQDTLLNTCGDLINRIWPDMSSSDRGNMQMMTNINYIAYKFQEMREADGDYPEPLPKVRRFMKEALGEDIVKKNDEIIQNATKEIEKELLEEVCNQQIM